MRQPTLMNVKQHMKYRVLTILCLIIPFACKKDSPPEPPTPSIIHDNSEGLMPLTIGNRWTIRYFMYDTTGAEIATFLDTVVIKRDTVIGNERWYNSARLKPPEADFLDFYTNRSDGFWVRRRVIRSGWDTAFSYVTFKYPTQPGESWGNVLGDSTRTVSTREIVTTPSGTDTCIKYEDHFQLFAYDGIIFYYYFKPTKGWVMFEIYSKTAGGRHYLLNKLVLVSVSLRNESTRKRKAPKEKVKT